MAKIAFLGLGVMGFPMAGHLVKKGGHEVTVYNRTGSCVLSTVTAVPSWRCVVRSATAASSTGGEGSRP